MSMCYYFDLNKDTHIMSERDLRFGDTGSNVF